MTWDYVKREVHSTMPEYVAKLLHRLQKNTPPNMQHQPHQHVPQNYGTKTQYSKPLNYYNPPDKEVKKFIMQVTGTFFYYGREVDGTMLTELSAITSEKSAPTKRTMKKCK